MRIYWSVDLERMFVRDFRVRWSDWVFLNGERFRFKGRYYNNIELTNYFTNYNENEVEMFLMLNTNINRETFKKEIQHLKEGAWK